MTRQSFEPSTTRRERATDRFPPRIVSLDEWRERLRTDPRGTVAELLEGFAHRRSDKPEVEDFFWRVLADHGTPGELVEAVLGRLRAPAAEARPLVVELGVLEPREPAGLLDLDREHRVRLRGRLRVVATELLAGFLRDPELREAIAADPVRLPETAFSRRRRWVEAAALFALEHDHLPRRGEEADRLARASLRYALARALHRVEGHGERALRLMESVLALASHALEGGADPGGGAPSARSEGDGGRTWISFAARLAFHAREWLGLRHYEAGRYPEAEREFRAAAQAAPETDLALAAWTFAANALFRDGRSAEAREILHSLKPHVPEMTHDVSEEWEELRRRLLEDLGEDELADD